MIVLDNININLIFQFNFSNYFAIIIYTMASLAQQQQQPQKQQVSIDAGLSGVVEIFCNSDVASLLATNASQLLASEVQMNMSSKLKMGITNLVPRGDLNAGRERLRLASGSLTALCQWGLPEDYIAGDLFHNLWDDDAEVWKRADGSADLALIDPDDVTTAPTNLILILYDTDQYSTEGARGSIRGIALCNVTEERMKLLVLGSIRTPMNIRNRHYARGGQLLRAVQFLGSWRKYIELLALETVITLYYKFGWRFVSPLYCGYNKVSSDQHELSKYSTAVARLKSLFDKARPGDPDEGELTSALYAFRAALPDRAKLIRTGEATGEDATEEARNNGYKMILCIQDNPYYQFQVTQEDFVKYQQDQGSSSGNSKGGRRRRRKRTKKKALKKKHRRTRRKKKRKTRRRRKRRGGKKKLSRKHCHSLKQQHTRMAHQLHRAGQAIRVQCGMHGGKRNLMPTKISCSIFGEADSCKNVAYKHQKGGDKSCVGAKDGVSGCKTCCGTNSGSCIDHCMK